MLSYHGTFYDWYLSIKTDFIQEVWYYEEKIDLCNNSFAAACIGG